MNNAKLQAYMRVVKDRFCPAEHELIDYHRGNLAAARADEIRAHVAACADCRQTLQEAGEFFAEGAENPSPGVVEREFHAVWDRVQAAPRSGTKALHYLPLAASVLIAAVAVSWSLWRDRDREQRLLALSSEVRALRANSAQQPRAQLRLVELFPAGTLTRGFAPETARIDVPEDRELILILNAQGWPAYPSYKIELHDEAERLRWTHLLTYREMGNFVVSVPAGYLTPGQYVISVAAGSSKKEYSFLIRSN